MKPRPPDASPAWWSQTRALLARAFGTVQVRQIGLEAPASAVADHHALEATCWPAPASGTGEQGWRLEAGTHTWQPPSAAGGGGDLDAAALPCAVSGNAAAFLASSGVHGGKADVLVPKVQALEIGHKEIGHNNSGAGTTLPLSVCLAGGQARVLPVSLPAPPVHAVPLALLGGSPAARARDGRGGIAAFAAPRTGSQLARLTRVPLLRRRTHAPLGTDRAKHFAAETQALASACGAKVEEVVFVASFTQVPLALVQQMAVTPDGDALRLWLRADALASGAGWTAARVTIVLGRRRDTGEAIRAVLPEARAAGRKQ